MKNQKGFSVIEALLILIIVGIIGGVIYYVYNANKQEIKISDSSVQHQEAITKEEFIDEVESEVKSLGLDNLAETKIVKPTPESGYANIQIFDKDGYVTGMETPVLEIVLNDELDCPIADYGEEECPVELDLVKEVNNAQEVYSAIESVVSKHSLRSDAINSVEVLKAKQANIDVPFGQYADIYAGYKNDSIVCIPKLPNMPSVFVESEPNIAVTKKISIFIGCVDVDEYEEQHELQKLL
ncbi:MAG: prepilin-type N-terminal cleavage/methylation domain-containing protein, partial [Candidatus Saccharimonadales bacterium]